MGWLGALWTWLGAAASPAELLPPALQRIGCLRKRRRGMMGTAAAARIPRRAAAAASGTAAGRFWPGKLTCAGACACSACAKQWQGLAPPGVHKTVGPLEARCFLFQVAWQVASLLRPGSVLGLVRTMASSDCEGMPVVALYASHHDTAIKRYKWAYIRLDSVGRVLSGRRCFLAGPCCAATTSARRLGDMGSCPEVHNVGSWQSSCCLRGV